MTAKAAAKVTPTIHTRVDTSLHKEMEAIAKKKGMSLAALSRDAFREFVSSQPIKRELAEVTSSLKTLTDVLADNMDYLQGQQQQLQELIQGQKQLQQQLQQSKGNAND